MRFLTIIVVLAGLGIGALPTRAAPPSWKQVRADFNRRFRDRDELERVRAVLGLADGAHPEAVEVLAELLSKKPTPGVFAYAVSALTRLKTPECTARMLGAYEKAEPLVRAAILLAFRTRAGDEVGAVGLSGLSEQEAIVRTSAVAALFHKSRTPTDDLLERVLADADRAVVSAALDRIESLELKAALPRLPSLLDSRYTRVREDAQRVLRTLTGKDFGRDRELWERWLGAGKEGTRDDAAYAPTFYGIRVIGSRPVFVLDISGSMLDEIRHPEEAHRGPVTGEGAAGGKPRLDWSKIRTKLDLAKAELVAVLEELPRDAHFGLVFYSDSVAVWKAGLLPATPKNVAAAVKRVKEIGAIGNTNVYDALLRALDMKGKGGVLDPEPGGPDQILFLTDGKANRGAIWSDRAIRVVLRVLYWLRRVRVDCVGVGDHDDRLLKGLASDARGRYVSVGR